MSNLDKNLGRLQIGCWAVFANLFFTGFCLWGLYAGYTSWRLDTRGETVTGTVVKMEQHSDSDGCCTYVPVIEFDAGGKTYSFKGDTAADPPQYRTGERVSVIYDPANPHTAQINKWTERWLFPIIIIPAMLLTDLIVNIVLVGAWIKGRLS